MTLVSKTALDDAFEQHPFRIAIVTRKFWPIFGPAEKAACDLAVGISQLGHDVRILTARWEKSWPSFYTFQEIPVHRINRNAHSPWSSFRYIRNIQREIEEQKLDGLIVYGLSDEAWAVSKAFGEKLPFIVRLDNHLLGCRPGRPNLVSRQIHPLKHAAKVLVESDWTASRLALHPAVIEQNLEVLPEGIQVDSTQFRSPSRQSTARTAISDAHPVLKIEPIQPLVICGSPLNGDEGLFDLVHAWRQVLRFKPSAKLWILGEGINSRPVWDLIVALDLVHSVVMPGSFDDLEDVFQAADLYVHALRSDQSCGMLDRAMVSGLCPLATNTAATQWRIQNDRNGFLVEFKNPQIMAQAILFALNRFDVRDRLGCEAATTARRALDISHSVSRCLKLLGNARVQDKN